MVQRGPQSQGGAPGQLRMATSKPPPGNPGPASAQIPSVHLVQPWIRGRGPACLTLQVLQRGVVELLHFGGPVNHPCAWRSDCIRALCGGAGFWGIRLRNGVQTCCIKGFCPPCPPLVLGVLQRMPIRRPVSSVVRHAQWWRLSSWCAAWPPGHWSGPSTSDSADGKPVGPLSRHACRQEAVKEFT